MPAGAFQTPRDGVDARVQPGDVARRRQQDRLAGPAGRVERLHPREVQRAVGVGGGELVAEGRRLGGGVVVPSRLADVEHVLQRPVGAVGHAQVDHRGGALARHREQADVGDGVQLLERVAEAGRLS